MNLRQIKHSVVIINTAVSHRRLVCVLQELDPVYIIGLTLVDLPRTMMLEGKSNDITFFDRDILSFAQIM